MSKLKSKKSISKKTKNMSSEKPNTDVKNVGDDFYDESTDLLNEEVWEYMNEQDNFDQHFRKQ